MSRIRNHRPSGIASYLKSITAHMNALSVREIDGLIWRLLDELGLPFDSVGTQALSELNDMRGVLLADYSQVPGLPSRKLLRELSHIVDTEIVSRLDWEYWDQPQSFESHINLFGRREIEVHARPYRQGSGLSLRGFFYQTGADDKKKFIIFLNTAHHPGAVAATFGHELGHYIYSHLVGQTQPITASIEGTFADHLNSQQELFADTVVSLSAYSRNLIRQIAGKKDTERSLGDLLFSQIRKAYAVIGTQYDLDLKRSPLAEPWRIRYLTSMIHFFKLRCAVFDRAEV